LVIVIKGPIKMCRALYEHLYLYVGLFNSPVTSPYNLPRLPLVHLRWRILVILSVRAGIIT